MQYLIINFYSPLNLGDLAILEQTLWLVERADPEATFDVCVSDDAHLPPLPRVRWLRNWNFLLTRPDRARTARALHQAYRRADTVLSLGGGYFFVHDHRPFSTWATLALAYALRLGKRVVCLPQSFGPFRHAYQARFAARLLSRCERVLLRDPESVALFARHAPPGARADLVPDTAFTLGLRWRLSASGKGNRHAVGATVVDWSPVNPRLRSVQAKYERRMGELLSRIVAELGAEVRLFVQCRSSRRAFESDLPATQRVQAIARSLLPTSLADQVKVVNDIADVSQALAAYGAMDAFIATRMHSAIFAATQGVPVLAIGYQPKLQATMTLLGQADYSLPIERAADQDLWERFQQLWHRRSEIGQRCFHAAQALGNEAVGAISALIRRYGEA